MGEKEAKVKEGIRILKCTCTHEYQDEIYGKGMRVHNVTKDGNAACTVCCPNAQRNKIDPATEQFSSPVFKHGTISARKDRNRFVKKVA